MQSSINNLDSRTKAGVARKGWTEKQAFRLWRHKRTRQALDRNTVFEDKKYHLPVCEINKIQATAPVLRLGKQRVCIKPRSNRIAPLSVVFTPLRQFATTALSVLNSTANQTAAAVSEVKFGAEPTTPFRQPLHQEQGANFKTPPPQSCCRQIW